jgi:Rrf2 family transcriptional regulator, nitric oxide-sensitive transcriptional repressor
MFTQTVEYALRAMVCLANANASPQTRSRLVEQTKVPSAYLAKVMREMNRAGLVHAQRGVNGGFTLAKPAEEVSLLEVMNAVDPLPRIPVCPLNLRGHGSRLCGLHRYLDDSMAALESSLAKKSLADLVAEKTGSIPLCEDESPHPSLTELG